MRRGAFCLVLLALAAVNFASEVQELTELDAFPLSHLAGKRGVNVGQERNAKGPMDGVQPLMEEGASLARLAHLMSMSHMVRARYCRREEARAEDRYQTMMCLLSPSFPYYNMTPLHLQRRFIVRTERLPPTRVRNVYLARPLGRPRRQARVQQELTLQT